ncbi:MAG: menaquinol oxidoreductase [Desulfitibacter sp. BRH_c19]|nr:MAG: menaquinol oxidoreductase [Desulfitibacter sp. BRH_c19]
MGIQVSLLMVVALILGVYLGVEVIGMQFLFGVLIPYIAFAAFVFGLVYRIVKWSRSPVPFRIPTTCGQQRSLPWFKQNKIDNPSTKAGVIIRMFFEVVFFRSLFRNTKAQLVDGNNGKKVVYHWEKWLWLAGLVFHWSFLIVVVRHLRFFTEPVPGFVQFLQSIDGAFQVNLEALYLTGIALLVAVTYLFIRRVLIPHVKYISLPADYFPLLLIFGIASSGILMKYFFRVDIIRVKELAMGLVTFNPTVPGDIGVIFYIHLFLVSTLLTYFPFSKLTHMAGIFMSPTRNMVNNNRAQRHVNPWNYPVAVHTYEEYEDEYRDKMKGVGLPVDKE